MGIAFWITLAPMSFTSAASLVYAGRVSQYKKKSTSAEGFQFSRQVSMLSIKGIAILGLLLLVIACGEGDIPPTPAPTDLPTSTATATSIPPPTPTHTPSPTSTSTPAPTSMPASASTPTPTTARITIVPGGDGRFYGPRFNPGSTYGEFFDQLTSTEQECVRDTINPDQMRETTFANHDPDDPDEVKLIEALVFICPSEEGRRERLYAEMIEDFNAGGFHPSDEELDCLREVLNQIPVENSRIDVRAEDEEQFVVCMLEWLKLSLVMTLANPTDAEMTPQEEDCLVELASNLEIDFVGEPNFEAIAEGIQQCEGS